MEESITETIGKRVRAKRSKEKISQKDLAKKVGITPAAINQFEKGEKKPSSIILREIALALGVSSDYLLGASEEEGLFIGDDVTTAFRDFKELSNKDRGIIMGHIEYLRSKGRGKK